MLRYIHAFVAGNIDDGVVCALLGHCHLGVEIQLEIMSGLWIFVGHETHHSVAIRNYGETLLQAQVRNTIGLAVASRDVEVHADISILSSFQEYCILTAVYCIQPLRRTQPRISTGVRQK